MSGSEAGQASATAWQNSALYPAGIFAAGGSSGEYQVGARSPAGICFLRVEAGGRTLVRRFVRMR